MQTRNCIVLGLTSLQMLAAGRLQNVNVYYRVGADKNHSFLTKKKCVHKISDIKVYVDPNSDLLLFVPFVVLCILLEVFCYICSMSEKKKEFLL